MPELLESILSETTEVRDFPYLAYLLAGWFHQDYLLESDDFKVIVSNFKNEVAEFERRRTIEDIDRFIRRYGMDSAVLKKAMDRVFFPCIIVEGWDGLTTYEWLLKVKELLQS